MFDAITDRLHFGLEFGFYYLWRWLRALHLDAQMCSGIILQRASTRGCYFLNSFCQSSKKKKKQTKGDIMQTLLLPSALCNFELQNIYLEYGVVKLKELSSYLCVKKFFKQLKVAQAPLKFGFSYVETFCSWLLWQCHIVVKVYFNVM